jgi:hypothetical protein
MSDTWEIAQRYRSDIVDPDEVRALAKSVYSRLVKKTKFSNVGIVFAFVGKIKPEFAIVTNHWANEEASDHLKVLLGYGDPIGVVGVSSGNGKGVGKGIFEAFKSKRWATKYAKAIIAQGNDVIPIARYA